MVISLPRRGHAGPGPGPPPQAWLAPVRFRPDIADAEPLKLRPQSVTVQAELAPRERRPGLVLTLRPESPGRRHRRGVLPGNGDDPVLVGDHRVAGSDHRPGDADRHVHRPGRGLDRALRA